MRWQPIVMRATIPTLVLVALTSPAATQAPPPAEVRSVSEAEGSKLLTTLCGSCHARGSIVGEHRSMQEWEEVLEWMIDEGAVMSDEEFERMVAYLSVRYGRVTINSAPADEIRHVLELTDAQSARLIAARSAGRRLGTVQDVADATGLPVGVLAARQARMDFD